MSRPNHTNLHTKFSSFKLKDFLLGKIIPFIKQSFSIQKISIKISYSLAIWVFSILTIFIIFQTTPAHTEDLFAVNHLKITPQDRILILAPHPDDEVLGTGGVIQKATQLNASVKIVFFTYGDNNQWSFLIYRKRPIFTPKGILRMGEIRRNEAIKSSITLGVKKENILFLGYPDFYTLQIWKHYWQASIPLTIPMTRVKAVPYNDAIRPGAPFKGQEILYDIEKIIHEYRPTKIFVSHPLDHHPDHQALYLFTMVALWNLENKLACEIYPYLIHYKNWPRYEGFSIDKKLVPPPILKNRLLWTENDLSLDESRIKYRALKKHKSQYKTNKKYLMSFIRSNELFGEPSALVEKEINTSSIIASLETTQEKFQESPFIDPKSIEIKNGFLKLLIINKDHTKQKNISSLYIFGYRNDMNFNIMPKLHIKITSSKYSVFNNNLSIPSTLISIMRITPQKMLIQIPLHVLGYPEKALVSISAHNSPILRGSEWGEWDRLEIISPIKM
ncbi:LmbE family protein [Candidatus Omnitrophus magneticus]|uniref:LmbE family protein n=1 Tax=Candidatus Omnitrophus magneticus TaxID=1609969 RepID=A0A0F0CQL6_9BACT|nr:LmbE family protein [Candidatus Omnitrophus magneticus]